MAPRFSVGPEKLDLVELALQIGEERIELLLGGRRRLLRRGERQLAARAA